MSFGEIPVALLAGLVSFLAPCVLPLVPGYLSAVSAVSAEELGRPGMARRVVVASIPFVLGFSAVFVALGVGASLLGGRLLRDQFLLEQVSGFVLVVFGLAFMGLLPWPERLVGAGLVQGARSSGSRVLLGGAFAVCAAPCIGPVLAAILVLAGSSDTALEGAVLLGAYSLGLGDPVRPRRRRLHADDGRVPLVARPLPGDPIRGRRRHGRPRPAALLREVLRAADLRQPRARVVRRGAVRVDGQQLDPHRQQVEEALGDAGRGRLDLTEDARHVDAAMRGGVGTEPPRGLLQLARRTGLVAVRGVVPGDGDVHEPLQEVALRSRRLTPFLFERLVRVEPALGAHQLDSPLETHTRPVDRARNRAMATILLVGVDLLFRSKLEGLLAGHRLVTTDSADEPDLVICDISRVDAEEVSDAWAETPILGFTNHTDTVGLQRANAAGFDQVIVKSALVERARQVVDELVRIDA